MGIFLRFVSAALLVGTAIGAAHGHGGGLDDRRCHSDSDTGRYHCHQGPLEGQSFRSEAAARQALSDDAPSGRTDASGRQSYDRDAYGDWRDRDGDCQDMRDEVLIEHARSYELDSGGCEVVDGIWHGPYTGQRLTEPSDIHIDHIVPLKEAHVSGAASWSARTKQRFANDPANLLPSEDSANMSKGALDPAEWLPDRNRCTYVKRWTAVKDKYDLEMDPAERRAVEEVERTCQ